MTFADTTHKTDALTPDMASMSEGAHAAARLAVLRLVVTGFRNYGRAAMALDARPVVLVGENGAGKTNILEALSFLTPGRGLRGVRLADVSTRDMSRDEAGQTTQPWGVAATVMTPDGTVDLGTGIGRTSDGDKRVVKVDGAAKSGSGVLGQFVRALWLTPQMDRLFIEGAGGRRRFLDRMVLGFDAGHSSRVSSYEKAMRERTRLLAEDNWNASWLSALEGQMAEHGVAIALARTHLIGQLKAAIAEHEGPSDTAFPKAQVALASGFSDEVDARLGSAASVDVEDAYAALLKSARGRDAAAGRALEGPHRADMLVRHASKNMDAQACSTGEQKALLIGLVLANARLHCASFGAPPLLLLDEVAAHLDARRRTALFDELERLGAQAWMTGTDASLFENLGDRAQLFNVAHGEITPQA